MAKIRSLIRKLGGFFRGKPKTPKIAKRPRTAITGGHRGIAAGSMKPGKMDLSPENQAKWRTLSAEAVAQFVHDEEPLFVHSSNVVMAQYFPDDEKMLVEFKNEASYLYSDVSQEEALDFAKANSKGEWVWDHLRIRGSKTGHQKKYVKVSSGYKPPTRKISREEADEFFENYE